MVSGMALMNLKAEGDMDEPSDLQEMSGGWGCSQNLRGYKRQGRRHLYLHGNESE